MKISIWKTGKGLAYDNNKHCNLIDDFKSYPCFPMDFNWLTWLGTSVLLILTISVNIRDDTIPVDMSYVVYDILCVHIITVQDL